MIGFIVNELEKVCGHPLFRLDSFLELLDSGSAKSMFQWKETFLVLDN